MSERERKKERKKESEKESEKERKRERKKEREKKKSWSKDRKYYGWVGKKGEGKEGGSGEERRMYMASCLAENDFSVSLFITSSLSLSL